MHKMDDYGRSAYIPLLFNTQITANEANNFTKAIKHAGRKNSFLGGVLLVYLNTFSATPAAPKLVIEAFDAELKANGSNPAAADFSLSTDEHRASQTYGAEAVGGKGETLPGNVLEFHFSPGFYRPHYRFNLKLDSTAGTETINVTAVLRLYDPQDVPLPEVPLAPADLTFTPA